MVVIHTPQPVVQRTKQVQRNYNKKSRVQKNNVASLQGLQRQY